MNNQQKRGAYTLQRYEIEKLLLACPEWSTRIAIRLMADAGLRRQEVVDLLISDIDFEKNRLNVTGKGGKKRIVPIESGFTQELKFFCGTREPGPVIMGRSKSKPVNKYTLNNWVKEAGQRANIKNPVPGSKNLNPHALRHAYARYLKNKGLSIEAIQNIMGHSNYKTTMDTYGLMSIDEIQAEFNDRI